MNQRYRHVFVVTMETEGKQDLLPMLQRELELRFGPVFKGAVDYKGEFK